MGMDEIVNIVSGYGIGKVESPLRTFRVPKNAKIIAGHVKELSEDALPINDEELGDLVEKLGLPRRKPAGYEEDEGGEVDEDADEDEEGVDIGILEVLEVAGITIGKYGQGSDVQFSVGFPLIDLGLEYFGKVAIGGKELEEAARVLKSQNIATYWRARRWAMNLSMADYKKFSYLRHGLLPVFCAD